MWKLKPRLIAAVRTAMQDQTNSLSLGNRDALRMALITCRPAMAAPLGPNTRPLMGRRSESWSIGHWRARALGPVRRSNLPPFPSRAAENTQHAKQNAGRCGASGGNHVSYT